MSIVDAYRHSAFQKKAEIAHLTEQKMKEEFKYFEANKKIHRLILSRFSLPVKGLIKTRQKMLLQYQENMHILEKRIAVYEISIAQKNRDYLMDQRIVNEMTRNVCL